MAAFDTTAGTLRRWHAVKASAVPQPVPVPEVQFLQGRPPSEPISACYFDGFIPAPMPPPSPGGTQMPEYDRGVFLVDTSGQEWMMLAGHKDTVPITRPVVDGP